ncbi:MAG: hydrogenase [Phormidium sp. BM_Day4_Bin.17]|nr:hydrogenase [Phormidium sp. BM_Day4_Bin.17]UCJ11340.1 MAG: hydrogenase [Phormidium sp. PBR-2020]
MKPDRTVLLNQLTSLEAQIAQLGAIHDGMTWGEVKRLLQSQPAALGGDTKAQAIAILDRFDALDHREQPGFQPLIQFKQQVRLFRNQVSNAPANQLPADVNDLLSGKHPVAQLLKAVDEGDTLNDAQWATLQPTLEKIFGQTIAIAASRGKLYVSQVTPTPQPVAATSAPSTTTPLASQTVSTPNAEQVRPQISGGADLLMWGDATETTKPAQPQPTQPQATQPQAPSGEEPLIVFGAKSLTGGTQTGSMPLTILVHIQGLGDRQFASKEFAGTRGQSRGLEGFQIRAANAIPGLKLEYMAHISGVGDTPWVPEGQYLGSRGENRQVEGFAIRLTGEAAKQYTIRYSGHIQNMGDTPVMGDGQYCGTRGKSLRVEGLRVWLESRS